MNNEKNKYLTILREIHDLLPDNNRGEITEQRMREVFSKVFEFLIYIKNKTPKISHYIKETELDDDGVYPLFNLEDAENNEFKFRPIKIKEGLGSRVFKDTEGEEILELWVENNNEESETLKSVMNRQNIAPKEIQFEAEGSNVWTSYIDRLNGFFFSNFTDPALANATGKNNIVYGLNSMERFTSASENLSIGNFSLRFLTEGKFNTAVGFEALNQLSGNEKQSSKNTAVGAYAGKNLTKGSANFFAGTYSGHALFFGVGEEELQNISPVCVAYGKSTPNDSGYDKDAKIFNSSHNTYVGYGINAADRITPSRGFMNTILGASPLWHSVYLMCNNVVVGAGNYMSARNSGFRNSLIFGNNINLPNQVDGFCIGNNRNRRISWNEGIIYGVLPNDYITINAPLNISPSYMRDANGDMTYTKMLVAKDNGEVGWAPKIQNSQTAPFTKGYRLIRPHHMYLKPSSISFEQNFDVYKIQDVSVMTLVPPPENFKGKGFYFILNKGVNTDFVSQWGVSIEEKNEEGYSSRYSEAHVNFKLKEALYMVSYMKHETVATPKIEIIEM